MTSVSTNVTSIVACTQTLLYFSFRSFRKHVPVSAGVREGVHSMRKKNKDHLSSSSPTPTPLLWQSKNPPQFLFFITCAQ